MPWLGLGRGGVGGWVGRASVMSALGPQSGAGMHPKLAPSPPPFTPIPAPTPQMLVPALKRLPGSALEVEYIKQRLLGEYASIVRKADVARQQVRGIFRVVWGC
jgi:hypothetical protein